jgi:hypothetical protein
VTVLLKLRESVEALSNPPAADTSAIIPNDTPAN